MQVPKVRSGQVSVHLFLFVVVEARICMIIHVQQCRDLTGSLPTNDSTRLHKTPSKRTASFLFRWRRIPFWKCLDAACW